MKEHYSVFQNSCENNTYKCSRNTALQQASGRRKNQYRRMRQFLGIVLLACGFFLIYLHVYFGSISRGFVAMKLGPLAFFAPRYENLPAHYDPFQSPSGLALALFARDRQEYKAGELAQAEREPGVIDFLVRLHHRKPLTQWNQELDLSKEPIVGGKLPHFVQWDERWAFADYAGGPFGETGCGPTCLSMAYTGLTGRTDYPPDRMAEFATNNAYAVDGIGSAWALMGQGARQLGLYSEEIGLDLGLFQQAIDQGKILVLSLGPGDFTKSGHFILLWNYDGEQFSILDPFNLQLGSRPWAFAELARQTSAAWALSLP